MARGSPRQRAARRRRARRRRPGPCSPPQLGEQWLGAELGVSQVQPADRLQEAVVRHTSALAFLSSHGRHHGALRGRKGASDEEGQRACLLGHHRACYMGEEARGLKRLIHTDLKGT